LILRIFIALLFSIGLVNGQAQDKLQLEDSWVNSTLSGMSLEQKIGQLFMVRAYSRGDLVEERKILNYVESYYIGGLCFFQGEPLKQIDAINVYQSRSRIPMFVAIDGEAGLGFRFPKDAMSFPKQTTLGAIENNDLIYEMGKEIARHCKATGININFAPVADINNNHANPVIFDRSYGDDVLNVTAKVFSYVKGLEEGGVMAVVKHFPGHGDTRTDSHDDLPRINHDRERLEAVEWCWWSNDRAPTCPGS
jgi:beta-N-acetylhexosaminidase